MGTEFFDNHIILKSLLKFIYHFIFMLSKNSVPIDKEKEFDLDWNYKKQIKKLEKEINHLHKIIDKFYETVDNFIKWICHKFGIGESKELIKNFQEENHTFIDPVKQIEHEKLQFDFELDK